MINALVLQGGGALGAYQAGVFEALAAADIAIDWVAGISIGAINAALIAGNPPHLRAGRLRAFWDLASSELVAPPLASDGPWRQLFNEAAASMGAAFGVPGFFSPRPLPPTLAAPGTLEAISWYDTTPLARTLAEMVDFSLINSGNIRFSVGAVNVRTGNFIYFDNETTRIGPEHIMASGALPPGFPPVVIDGEAYWDGGLVSNTPLQYVLDSAPGVDATIYQVDLFSARGSMPQNLFDVAQREKDIRFSSRTRLNTEMAKRTKNLRAATRRLLAKLPPELANDPDARAIAKALTNGQIAIMQLINRPTSVRTSSKDYEFSRSTVNEHWQAGRNDTARSLASPRWQRRPQGGAGIFTFDIAEEPRPHGAF